MDKNGFVTISYEDWGKGIANSPYDGVAHIRNLDIYTKPGVLKISPSLTKTSSSTVTSLCKYMTVNPDDGKIWAADTAGKIYFSSSGSSWTYLGTGNTAVAASGLAVFKDYLYFFYGSGGTTQIDRYGPLSGSPTWSLTWNQLIATNLSHCPTLWAQDDILYIGAGRYVASVNSAGTFTAQALNLASRYYVQSIQESGIYLLVGCQSNNGTGSVVFPWITTQSSFNFGIHLNRSTLNQMVMKDNLLYVNAGAQDEIIVSNLASSQPIKNLNNLFTNPLPAAPSYFPSATASILNSVCFGLGKTADASNNGPVGIWSYRDKAWTMMTPSFGDGANASGAYIGAMAKVSDDSFVVSWQDLNGSTTGIDQFTQSNNTSTGYKAYMDSKIYNVGTSVSPKSFSKAEIFLGKELASSQGIQLSYRTSLSDSFTTINSYEYGDGTGSDTSNLGGIIAFTDTTMNIPPAVNIQFRVALQSSGGNTTSPELLFVRFS